MGNNTTTVEGNQPNQGENIDFIEIDPDGADANIEAMDVIELEIGTDNADRNGDAVILVDMNVAPAGPIHPIPQPVAAAVLNGPPEQQLRTPVPPALTVQGSHPNPPHVEPLSHPAAVATPRTLENLKDHIGRALFPPGSVEHLDLELQKKQKKILKQVLASHEIIEKAEAERIRVENIKQATRMSQKIFYENILSQSELFYDWGRSKVVVVGSKHHNKTRRLINSLLGEKIPFGKSSENECADLSLFKTVLTPRRENDQQLAGVWNRNFDTISRNLNNLGVLTHQLFPMLVTFAMNYATKETLMMTPEERSEFVSSASLPNSNNNEKSKVLPLPGSNRTNEATAGKLKEDIDYAADHKKLFNFNLAEFGMRYEFSISLLEFQSNDVSSHRLFHNLIFTPRGVYIIVCDASKLLGTATDMENEINALREWVSSIQFFAPESHFLIVAAYDKPISYPSHPEIRSDDELVALVNTMIKDNLDLSTCQNLVINEKDGLCFFPNRAPSNAALVPLVQPTAQEPPTGAYSRPAWLEGIENHHIQKQNAAEELRIQKELTYTLQRAVEDVIRKQNTKNPCLVSARWVVFIEHIFKYRDNAKISLNVVKEFARKQFGIYSSDEVHRILSLLHDLGLLFYLPTTEILRNTIILKPAWLLESLNKILIFKDAYDKNEHFEGKITGLEGDADMLIERGLASLDLLEHIWGRDDANFLIDAMLEMMYMSPWGFGCEKDIFFIPSFLRENGKSAIDVLTVASEKGKRLMIDFLGTPVPTSLFHRLVCLFVDYSGKIPYSEDPKLSRSAASVWFGNVPIHLWHNKPERDAIYVHIGGSSKKQKGTSLQSCISSIHTMVRKVVEDTNFCRTLSWKLKFEYNVGKSFKFLDLKDAKAMKKENTWFPKTNKSKRVKSGTILLTFDQITDFANLV